MTGVLFIVLRKNIPFSDALQFCGRENLFETIRKSAGILAYFKLFHDVSDDFIRAKPVSPYVSEPNHFALSFYVTTLLNNIKT